MGKSYSHLSLAERALLQTQLELRCRPAAIAAGLQRARSTITREMARNGWHTFRHSYRSWLDETGAPMKVQQELMRHASIQTTMNVYGQALSSSKREANSKIVEMVLRSARMSA
jgi:integrase